jgi:hypothetical protein
MSEQMPVNIPQEFPKNIEKIEEQIDMRADRADFERQQAAAPTLKTEKTKQFNALPDITAHADELVPEKDIHGPLQGAETLKAVDQGAETVRPLPAFKLESAVPEHIEEPLPAFTLKTEAKAPSETTTLEAQTKRAEGSENLDVENYREVMNKVVDAMELTQGFLEKALPGSKEILLQRYMRLAKVHASLIEEFTLAFKAGINDQNEMSVEVPADWRKLEKEMAVLPGYNPAQTEIPPRAQDQMQA